MTARWFNLAEARALLPAAKARADQVIAVRAELAIRMHAVRSGDRTQLADAKGGEARLGEILEWFAEQGIEVKGFAPILIDFPSRIGGREVLLCWLENEADIGWWHDPEQGFMGRRPLAELGTVD